MDKLNEIKTFWKTGIYEYDDIVEVREAAYSDIYNLIDTIISQQQELNDYKKALEDIELIAGTQENDVDNEIYDITRKVLDKYFEE